MTRNLALWRCFAVTTVVAIWMICLTANADSDAARQYEAARKKLVTQDYAGAIVELKNALQQDQHHLPARLLLGQTYLHNGQAAAAEKEFRIALALGADKNETVMPLGNALLMQRKYQAILDLVENDNSLTIPRPENLILAGRAYYELGELNKAKDKFQRAVDAAPTRAEPFLGLVSIAIAQGDLKRAAEYSDRALELAPKDPETWFQRGELWRIDEQHAKAIESLTQALKLNPSHMRAHLARCNAYLALGKYAQAKEDAVFVHTKVPRDPEAAFLLWQTAVLLHDQKTANDASAKAFGILKTLPDDFVLSQPSILRTACLLSMARQNYELAGKYLYHFTKLRPNDLYMRKLYGQALVRQGNVKGGAQQLFDVSRALPKDADLFAELGRAYLTLRQYDDAKAALEHAAELAPDAKELTTPLALSTIGTGAPDAAVAALAEAEKNSHATNDSSALRALLQLKRGDGLGARTTIETLLHQTPDDPFLLNLAGTIDLKLGDLTAGRKHFQSALAKNEHYLAAAYNLTQLDLREVGPKVAIDRLRGLLKQNSKFVPAMNLMAEIAVAEGRISDAVQWLEKARAIDTPQVAEQEKLIELYVALGRKKEAVAAANAYVDAHGDRADARILLARVDEALGNREDAKVEYRKATRSAVLDGDSLIQIAHYQVGIGDYQGARRTLEFATAAGHEEVARPALVRLEIAARNFDDAERQLERMSFSGSDKLINILRGELSRKRGKLKEAIQNFETAMKMSPATDAVLGLYEALVADGQSKRAYQILADWNSAHPDDIVAARALAIGYIANGDFEHARELHEKLIRVTPNDALLLANLARIYQIQKRPEARQLAERALQVDPQSAGAMDTLGWILATNGALDDGLKYLRDAIARDANPVTRFHLASVLHELKRNDEAKIELNRIIGDAGKYPLRDQARQLLDQIAQTERP